LAYTLMVIYLLMANIVLLSLLVSMLSNSFDLVKYDASKEFLLVRARFILYIQKTLGKETVNQLCKLGLFSSPYLTKIAVAADLKERAKKSQQGLVGHNNTPDAEFVKTNQYSEWEDKSKIEDEDHEVNLQVLREELLSHMDENESHLNELLMNVPRCFCLSKHNYFD